MNEQMITIYCLYDDYIKSIKAIGKEWPNQKMSNAEVMTIVIIASCYFYGNIERAKQMLKETGYINNMVSKSRLNRRMHLIPDTVWQNLLKFSHLYSTYCYIDNDFIVDRFSVSLLRKGYQ